MHIHLTNMFWLRTMIKMHLRGHLLPKIYIRDFEHFGLLGQIRMLEPIGLWKYQAVTFLFWDDFRIYH